MKELIKSKTFYAGLGLVLYGISHLVQGGQEEGFRNILEGLSIIFLRQGIMKAAEGNKV